MNSYHKSINNIDQKISYCNGYESDKQTNFIIRVIWIGYTIVFTLKKTNAYII